MRTLIVAACLIAAPAHAQPGAQKLGPGDWYGIGQQVGPQGVQSTWTIELSLTGTDNAAISYPSLGCTAKLHRIMSTSNQIEFREEITAGNCIDHGHITAILRNNRLYWFWSKPSAGADASAVLYRDQPIG